MFLKNKWNNLSIKKKNFIWSVLIIIISFTLLYGGIYLFMPKVYENYKLNKIYSSIEELKTTLEETEDLDLSVTLDKFSYDNNLDLILVKKDKENRIVSIVYSSFREWINDPGKIPFLKEEELPPHILKRFKLSQDEVNEAVYKPINKKGSLNIENDITIRSLKGKYSLIVHVAVSPIDEAATIVALFFPFAIITIIVIAIAISTFYSIQISKPLIKINDVAKKMSNLDFDNVIEIKGDDEIGQLSKSLNLMNENLKNSFKELEHVNSKLTEEIELERKIEKQRREFIATISHELKSPITIISGQIEGMIYKIGKYKDRDKYLKESYDVVQKMRELVQELLDMSRREDQKLKCIFVNMNLSMLVEDILNDLYYFCEDKNITLEKHIEESVYINGDINLLTRAITNIIKNSIVHSPINEKVIISLNKKELAVQNTGVNIPENEIENIFEAFYRVDKSRNRKTGGTGLGLYIVKSILDQHKNIKYSIYNKDNSVVFYMRFDDND